MSLNRFKFIATAALCSMALMSCENARLDEDAMRVKSGRQAKGAVQSETSLTDIFKEKGNTIKVNRFLWTATLETLDFLPMQTADPYTGVIITGYGRPPGGGTAYKATVLISDPALDARALNVSLQTSNGRPVDQGTRNAVEDAILTRARQLRVEAGKY